MKSYLRVLAFLLLAAAVRAQTAPVITTQPAGLTATAGASVTLSVVATGTSLTYQWRKGTVSLGGATNSSYTIASVAPTDAGSYDVVVANAAGSINSAAAAIAVSGMTTDGFSYTSDVAGVTITGYSGTATAVTIPSSVAGRSVTAIGASAFSGNTTMTSVVIPNTVASIGATAFDVCRGLTSVSIPASVTSISFGIFRHCTALTSISVDAANPAYVATADGKAILDKAQTRLVQIATGLTGSYSIPAGITSIAGGAFYGCNGMTQISFPAGLTSIEGYAFAGCGSLTSVVIPASVTSIGDCPFYFGTKITSFSVEAANPNYTMSADGKLLMDKSLSRLIQAFGASGTYVIPPSVTVIGGNAFAACSALTSVIIPNGVTLIDYYAFNACTALSDLTLPSSVTSLGVYLLQGCSKVSAVTFLGNRPAEVTDLFAGSSVTSVRYLEGTTGWGTTYGGIATVALPVSGTTTDGFSYLFTGTGVTITGYSGPGGNIAVPAQVAGSFAPMSIGANAFAGSTTLLSVSLPASVTSVGDGAFANCSQLASVVFAGNAPAAGSGVFAGTTGVSVWYAGGATGWGGGISGVSANVLGAPVVVTDIASRQVLAGVDVSFAPVVSGGAVTYQWYRDNLPIAGATRPALSIASAKFTDAGAYWLRVTNSLGSAVTARAVLSGSNSAPAITTQPANLTVTAGQAAQLSVVATGTGPLSYQWRRNAVPLPGATLASLGFTAASRTDADVYDVLVGDGLAVTTSNGARLSVAPVAYPGQMAVDPAWDLRLEASVTPTLLATVPAGAGMNYVTGLFTSINGLRSPMIARVSESGVVDTTFAAREVDGAVRAAIVQADGKIVIGGDFLRIDGVPAPRIARLNPDGSLDPTFRVGTSANGSVYSLVQQSGGKILVGGAFSMLTARSRGYLVRLNADGSLDESFGSAGAGLNGTVTIVLPDSAGALYAGGSFTTMDGVSANRLVKLTASGALDATFAIGSGFSSTVNALAMTAEGRLLVGGGFTLYNGVSANRIVRLLTTGAIDATFTAGSGAGATVNALRVLADGRVLVGGTFTTFNGDSTIKYLARLSPSGVPDGSPGTPTGTVNGIVANSSGTISVAGNALMRVGADGLGLTTASLSWRGSGSVAALVSHPGGKVLVAGSFTFVRGASCSHLLRISPDGTIDATYNQGGSGPNGRIAGAVSLAGGGVAIVGAFTTYNGLNRGGVAVLRPDGTLDTSFTPDPSAAGSATSVTLLSGGRLAVTGTLGSLNGATANRIRYFLPDGSLDPAPIQETTTNSPVIASTALGGDRFVLGGNMTMTGPNGSFSNTINTRGLVALLPTGGVDSSFNSRQVGANSTVNALATQPDGKILIAGAFSYFNGISRSGLARLSATGALDTTFSPSSSTSIFGLLLQEDGKVIVRGGFSSAAGAARTAYIARLSPTGATDSTFSVSGLHATTSGYSPVLMLDSGQLVLADSFHGVVATRAAAAPVILSPPQAQVAAVGGSATFSVTVGSNGTVSYQWLLNGNPIPGATGSTLSLSDLKIAQAGLYSVAVSNESGTTVSTAAALGGTNPAPVISQQPADVAVVTGQPATFTVSVTGSGPYSYQWRRNGFPMAGATASTLPLASVTRADADRYDVQIADGLSVTTSNPVRLQVAPSAYPGSVVPDPAWNLSLENSGGVVSVVVPLADGGAYVAGNFSKTGTHRSPMVFRLKPDTTVDTTFQVPEIDSSVQALAVQPDGRVIIGGSFTRIGNSPANRIARLNANGSLDATFNPGSGLDSTVNALLIQADGKVVLGGAFTLCNGIAAGGLARLKTDGSLDTSFNSGGAGASGTVTALLALPDQKILVGGTFGTYNGQAGTLRLVRVTADGAVDSTFTSGSPNSTVRALALQPDGSYLVGGDFTAYGTTSLGRIARVLPSGTLDLSFSVGATGFSGSVYAIAVRPDGSVLVGGSYVIYDGVSVSNCTVLSPQGVFQSSLSANSTVFSIAPQADGKIWVGGSFSTFISLTRPRVTRLTSALANDTWTDFEMRSPGSVSAVIALPDGKFLIGGSFTYARDAAVTPHFLRLTSAGAIDPTFNAGGVGPNSSVSAAVRLSDGRIGITGGFTTYNGINRTRLAVLNADGTLDATFVPPATGISSGGNTMAVLPRGKLLVGGSFTNAGGEPRSNVAVFCADGSLDADFKPAIGSTINCSLVQPDGRILLGGSFTTFNGASASRLLRLNPEGSLDTSFSVGSGISSTVFALALQPDGKIIIAGAFATVQGVTQRVVSRLLANGTRDSTFTPSPAFASGATYGLHVQEDGRILLRGAFATGSDVQGTQFLTRLNADGSRDDGFQATGFNALTSAAAHGLAMADSGRFLSPGFLPGLEATAPGPQLQSINFAAIPTKYIGEPAFAVNATASSGLPVSFSVASGPATVSGSTVTLTGAGTVTIRASQEGNAVYAPAANAYQTFTVSAANPLISAGPVPQSLAPGSAVTLSVTAAGSGSLSYQWSLNGASIPGATASTYTIPSVQLASAGRYQVTVSNSVGAAYSTPALVRLTGNLWATGSDSSGQLGLGTQIVRAAAPVANAARMAAGDDHTLIVKADGTLWAVGLNNYGQLGDGSTTNRTTAVQVATGVVAAAAGDNHSAFLKSDGTVWTMGINNTGQLGDGTTTNRSSPVMIASGVASISAGNNRGFFVKNDGTLWAFGMNQEGQLGDGTTTDRSTPVQVASNVSAVSAGGYYHTIFLKTDGTVWAMGLNTSGQLGDGTTTNRSTPVQVASGAASVSSGGYHSLFIKSDGTLWATGSNSSGQLGDGTVINRSLPVQVAAGVGAVSAGFDHTLFLKVDGGMWAMGRNHYGQLADGTLVNRSSPVQVATGVASVASGYSYSLFLKGDQVLWAAGRNSYGQLGDGVVTQRNTPGLVASDVAEVSAGNRHALFLKGDSTLWGMGENVYGQLGDGTNTTRTSPVQVASGVVAASAASYYHSLFVKADGTLWAMGLNNYGQLGDGTTTSRTVPVQVATNVWTLATGDYFSLFVKRDGTLWAMGLNASGQLGDGTTSNRYSPVQVASGVVAVSAGDNHSIFLRGEGTAWTMGLNDTGQLGDGTNTNRLSPVQVATTVASVSAGNNHCVFVKTDGTLWTMGFNNYGQIGDGTLVNRNSPVQIASGVVAASAAGRYHTVFIKGDGSLWGTGLNGSGQLGDGSYTSTSIPVQIAGNALGIGPGFYSTYFIQASTAGAAPVFSTQPANVVTQLGAAVTLTAAASGTGPIDYRWRKNGVDVPGARGSTLSLPWFQSADTGSYTVVATNSAGSTVSTAAAVTSILPVITAHPATQSLAPGGSATLSVSATGAPPLSYQWTRNGVAITGATNATYPVTGAQLADSGRYQVAVTNAGGTALSAPAQVRLSGSLWAMGLESYGQFANGVQTRHAVPAAIATGVKAVSAGGSHSLLLKTDGTVWATGYNFYGQLGDGTSSSRSVPVQVAAGVTDIHAGDWHSLIRNSDGSLWAMGRNSYGSLGDGTTTHRYVPVQVAASVTAFAAGGYHSLFVKADGTLWAAGRNQYGQLGDGTTTNRSTPVQIATSVVAVAAGGYHSLYLKADGTVWAVGYNGYGQLGDGSTTDRTSPVQITAGAKAIVAVGACSFVLKTDGTLWAAGVNSYGQLGDGSTSSRSTLVQVASSIAGVAAGGGHSLFRKTDGSLWATGDNAWGQFGDGSTSGRSTPFMVSVSVGGMAAGYYHSLVLKTDGTVWSMGSNSYGQLGDGTTTARPLPVLVAPDVAAAAAGASHSLYLQPDGTLRATGHNYYGQLGDGLRNDTVIPVQMVSGVISAVAGTHHSLLIKPDASLWAAGANYNGQLGDGTLTNRSAPVQVATGVAAAASWSVHSLFLKVDGTLWAMGYNGYGQLGDGTTTDRSSPVQVASGVTAFAAGANHSLFIKSDGSLWAMGYNNNGQLGDGTTTNRLTPVQVATGVASVAAGGGHSLFVKVDGTLWGMGNNGSGQLGDGSSTNRPSPIQIASSAFAIAAGNDFSLFLKPDGTLWAMGFGAYGQLGDGAFTTRVTPVQIATNVLQVEANTITSYFIQRSGAGTVPVLSTQPASATYALGTPVTLTAAASGSSPLDYRWQKDGIDVPGARGSTLYLSSFQLGDVGAYTVIVTNSAGSVVSNAATLSSAAPVITTHPANQSLAPGGSATLSVSATGTAPLSYQWSRNGVAITGATNATYPIAGAQLADSGRYQVAVTNADGTALSAPAEVRLSGLAWAVGSDVFGQLGIGRPMLRTVAVPVMTGVAKVSAGVQHSLVVKADGTLWSAGYNTTGALGDGTYRQRSIFGQVATGVVNAAAGTYHSLFVKTDGTLWSVGYNASGQLGNGGTNTRVSPVQVSGGSAVASAAAGYAHSLFVKTDGTLWAMGENGDGQLGDGSTTDRSTPVQVATGVRAVVAGWYFSLFVKTDGTLWGMGQNQYGQLGDGTTLSRSTPVQIASGVQSIGAGSYHSLFVKTDGTLWAIGLNTSGQLGDGSTVNRSSPVQVAVDVTAVAAGAEGSRFIKGTGSLWAMGSNAWGQFGDGSLAGGKSIVPVQVADNVREASTAYHTLIIERNGVLSAAGINEFGELGDGSTVNEPNPVLSGSGVVAVSGGTYFQLQIRDDGSLWASGRNTYGQLGDGTGVHRNVAKKILDGVLDAVAGDNHSLLLKVDGTLWTTGRNTYGQLGDGATANRLSPFQVASSVVAAAAGSEHSLFLKSDGSVWAMGLNSSGQFGSGTSSNSSVPVQVATGVSAIAAGGAHSLFLKTDGSAWAMGANGSGQLGDGTTQNRSVPVPLATGVAAIAAAGSSSYFIKTDGTLWSTGGNMYGELGDGTYTNRSLPAQISTGVVGVAAGGNHAVFLKTDGTAWAIGDNLYGELGDGTQTNRTLPVQVGRDVLRVGSGVLNSYFVQRSSSGAAPVFTTQPMGGSQVLGSVVTLSAAATGMSPVDYRWQKDGVDIPAERGPSMHIPYLRASDAGSYRVIATDAAGTSISSVAVLEVLSAPVITTHPANQAVSPGGTISLGVVATGGTSYQWSRNGVPLSGVTQATLTIAGAQLSSVGRYNVTVSNPAGSVTSGSAWVSVTGRAWGVGVNEWGQLADEIPLLSSAFFPAMSKVKQVSAGGDFVAFIKSDNSLWAMGRNSYGQLGQGDMWARGRPVLVATGVASVSAGNERLFYIKQDGTLWGVGNLSPVTATPVPIASAVRSVSTGGFHALFVTVSDELWALGQNGYGQLGDGSNVRRDSPVKIASGVSSASAGSYHSLFLKTDGSVWATGRNNAGQLGDGTTTDRSAPAQVVASAAAISAGSDHNLLIKTDGSLWSWGDDAWWARKLGLASGAPVLVPTLVTQGVSAIAAGGNHSLFRKTDGALWAMGFCYYGSVGNGSTATGPTSTGLPVKVADAVSGMIAAGGTNSAYLTDDGTLWLAGGDHWGQLGRGRVTQRTAPILLGGPAEVIQASAGYSHSLIVASDGGLWATGSNVYWSMELGDGTDQSKTSPVKVADGVTQAWAGGSNSFFLKTDRSLWGMGYNSVGQLGDGTTTTRNTPRQIAAGVSAVSSGDGHTLFVKDDGQLMATGRNDSGQLGDGTTTARLTPVVVASNVAVVAAGQAHSLFVKHDGTLWGMGRNTYGELGDGTQTSRSVPVQLMSGVSAVAAGVSHSLVLKQDGTLWAFGGNGGGSLGDGTMTMRTTPVQVASGVVAIAARDNNSRFLKADGTLWGMGNNWNGQLADASGGMKSSPVLIAGNVVSISMGANHGLFVQQRITGAPPSVVSSPAAVSATPGDSVSFAVTAQGAGPLAYEWRRNGVAIPGAKDPVLVLTYLRAADAGSYSVVVINAAGTVTSSSADLTVPVTVAGSLINGSVLLTNGTGSSAVLGVFTIEGSAAKQMLIRGVGPSLTAFGVNGALADPRLEIVHAGTGLLVAGNDDWDSASNASQVASVTAQVGAFPLPAGGKDAVVLGAFAPGTYRVRLLGAGTSTGACLLEIYAADATPRLVQLSTRAPVGGNAGTLLQGFVASNVPAGRSYLIRALGPSLGLAGSLSDPALALFSGNTSLAANDNWGGDAAVAAAVATAGAMPLPVASKDAALLFTPTVAGGGYTVQLSGVGSSSGLALLEIFEVDAQRPASFAPALVSTAEDVAVAAGQPVALGVVATGKPAPAFQWRKDGVALVGATNASHSIASATAADAGGYTVTVSNAAGTITSPVANVTVSGEHTATHSVAGNAYLPGATVTVTNTLTYAGTATSLGWQVTLPAGWSFVSDAGSPGEVKPVAGTTGSLEWAWTTVPASPVTFTYTVKVPSSENIARSLTASAIVRTSGSVATVTAAPSPLTLSPITNHSGDTDLNFRFSLLELTRVIELYNTRNGTNRTGAYAVATTTTTEDGFAPDPARASSAVVTLARHHSADSNRDGKISLLELTRVIELYNYRTGTTRTGDYHVHPGSEDGFNPGPASAHPTL